MNFTSILRNLASGCQGCHVQLCRFSSAQSQERRLSDCRTDPPKDLGRGFTFIWDGVGAGCSSRRANCNEDIPPQGSDERSAMFVFVCV
jgi:hypothetical protein